VRIRCDRRRRQRLRANQRLSAPRRGLSAASIACSACNARFTVAEDAKDGAPTRFLAVHSAVSYADTSPELSPESWLGTGRRSTPDKVSLGPFVPIPARTRGNELNGARDHIGCRYGSGVRCPLGSQRRKLAILPSTTCGGGAFGTPTNQAVNCRHPFFMRLAFPIVLAGALIAGVLGLVFRWQLMPGPGPYARAGEGEACQAGRSKATADADAG
jgi:hypothetical protein